MTEVDAEQKVVVPAIGRKRASGVTARLGRTPLSQLLIYGLLLAVPLVAFDQRWMAFVTLAGMWGIAALGLGLIMGYGGQLSLGHAALVGVGAYAAGIVARDLEWGYGLSLLAGVLAAVVLALLTLPILRLRGYYLALATHALGLNVERLLVIWDDLTGGPSGLVGIPDLRFGSFVLDGDDRWWVVTVVLLAACQLVIRRMVSGGMGRSISVLHEDEDLMPALRMDPVKLKARLFLVGSAMAGLAGGLLAHRLNFLAPEQFNVETSILLALVVLFGGATSWWGPLIGTVVLRVMPELFLETPHLRGVLIPIVVVVLLFVAPDGAFGLLERAARLLPWGPSAAGGRSLRDDRPTSLEPAIPALSARAAGEGPLLEVRSVSKAFGGVQVLADVSFTVAPGEVVGLIGPNGAGKTTLLNMVAGQLPLDSGEILYKGERIGRLAATDGRRAGVVRTFQTPRLIERLSVLENVTAGADAARARDPFAAGRTELRRLDRLELADRSPSELAFGGMRATEFARGFAMQPDLLLLDEPAAGLGADDMAALDEMLQQCAAAGIGVVLVEHNMEFLTRAVGKVVALANGVVVASGTPEAVLSDDEVIEHYLGAVT